MDSLGDYFVGVHAPVGVAVICVYTFVLCIPFGYWRTTTNRFSVPWFAAVHLPVLLIVPLRTWWFHLSPWSLFLLVPLFFVGHSAGATVRTRWARRVSSNLSACLVVDLYRHLRRSPHQS